MGPNFDALAVVLGEVGLFAALLLTFGVALLLAHLLPHDTLAEREAAFLHRFAGCPDNRAGVAPLNAGEAAPLSSEDRSSDGATRHANAVRRPLYALQGYTPAPLHDDRDTLPPADRSFASGCGAAS